MMPDRKKVIKGLECHVNGHPHTRCHKCPYWGTGPHGASECNDLAAGALALLKAQEPITGETSDGYHTFNELYHHRAVLFSVIVSSYPERAWKAKKHHDGTMYDGMFIVGIETPSGQATYHYDINPYWDMFKCRELANAPEWDGHTPAQAIERIGGLAGLKAQEPRVMTLEELKALPSETDVWLDEFCSIVVAATISCTLYGNAYFYGIEHADYGVDYKLADYGKEWRCWTSRPTDEQRQAVRWK